MTVEPKLKEKYRKPKYWKNPKKGQLPAVPWQESLDGIPLSQRKGTNV